MTQHGIVKDRNARIIAAAMNGDRPRDIAERFCIKNSLVSLVLSNARQEGYAIPKFRGGGRQRLRLETGPFRIAGETQVKLRDHAEKRGLTINGLAKRLIEAIANDNLVDAILDDQAALLQARTEPREASPRNGEDETRPAIPAVNRAET